MRTDLLRRLERVTKRLELQLHGMEEKCKLALTRIGLDNQSYLPASSVMWLSLAQTQQCALYAMDYSLCSHVHNNEFASWVKQARL